MQVLRKLARVATSAELITPETVKRIQEAKKTVKVNKGEPKRTRKPANKTTKKAKRQKPKPQDDTTDGSEMDMPDVMENSTRIRCGFDVPHVEDGANKNVAAQTPQQTILVITVQSRKYESVYFVLRNCFILNC